MAKILNNKKSTGSKPYAYYSVEATSNNRSTSSVDVTIKVTSNLQADASSLGIGNNFGLIGYITLNNTEFTSGKTVTYDIKSNKCNMERNR